MQGQAPDRDGLPPHSPEAEMGVLGCCLLDVGQAAAALKAGVTSRWFFELRHQEIFNVLQQLATNGGGDMVVVTIQLRERGLLDKLLAALGNQRLTTTEWRVQAKEKRGINKNRFYELVDVLQDDEKVLLSVVDDKWSRIREDSRNSPQ